MFGAAEHDLFACRTPHLAENARDPAAKYNLASFGSCPYVIIYTAIPRGRRAVWSTVQVGEQEIPV